jgi:hypothetical protein
VWGVVVLLVVAWPKKGTYCWMVMLSSLYEETKVASSRVCKKTRRKVAVNVVHVVFIVATLV